MRHRMLAATCAALTTVPAADAVAAEPPALDGLVAKARPLHPFPGRATPAYPPAVTAALRLASDAVVRQRLVRTNLRLARTHATLAGGHVGHRYAANAQRSSLRRLRIENVSLKRENAALRAAAGTGAGTSSTGAAAGGLVSAPLQAIAQCESGGNPAAVGGGGAYRGKYQFDRSTWASIGGSGDPAAAPEGEQDRRAAALYVRSGASPWPVCGR